MAEVLKLKVFLNKLSDLVGIIFATWQAAPSSERVLEALTSTTYGYRSAL